MEVPFKDLPTPFKWVGGGLFCLVLLFIAVRHMHEARKASREADAIVAASPPPSAPFDSNKQALPNRSIVANRPEVKNPSVAQNDKKPKAEGGSGVIIEPNPGPHPVKVEPISKSQFYDGTIVVIDGPRKGHRFVVAEAKSKQNFSDRIRLQFRDPSGELVEVTFLCNKSGLVEVGKTPDARGWATLKWVPGE